MTQPGDINDILGQERILMVAWLLPNDGPLSDAQRKQAMGNFTAYLRLNNITAMDVARQIGKPKATTIGELMKGKYREGSDGRIRTLNMFIEQHARARAASLTGRFVTSLKVAKAMLTVGRLARENKTLALVIGPAGIGKSRCAMAIHEKYVGSIYIRIIAGYHHQKGLTHALAEKLGVRYRASSQSDRDHHTQLERVMDVLRNSNRLIILDEAGKLTASAMELLRDIHDECGVPALLVATRDLHDRIVENADPDHGQLYSRFDVIHHLTEGYDVYSGGKALHTMDDIRQLYNEPPVKLSPDAARYLQGVSNDLGRGLLRRCKMLLQNAARRATKRQGLAAGERVTVTADDLAYVERLLRRESSEQQAVSDRRRHAAAAAEA